jgi:hypothetical protein
MGAVGAVVTGSDTAAWWPVDGSSAGDRCGVVANESGNAVAGFAAVLRKLEDGL